MTDKEKPAHTTIITKKLVREALRKFHKTIAPYKPYIDDLSGWLVIPIKATNDKEDRTKIRETLKLAELKGEPKKGVILAPEYTVSTTDIKIDPTALAGKFIHFGMSREAKAAFPPDIFEKAKELEAESAPIHPLIAQHKKGGRRQ